VKLTESTKEINLLTDATQEPDQYLKGSNLWKVDPKYRGEILKEIAPKGPTRS
jgi:hypothetical protein